MSYQRRYIVDGVEFECRVEGHFWPSYRVASTSKDFLTGRSISVPWTRLTTRAPTRAAAMNAAYNAALAHIKDMK